MIKRFKCKNPLEVLSPGQLRAIREQTLEILAETGLIVEDRESLELLADQGASVDWDHSLVRLPACLVGQALAGNPGPIALKATNEADQVIFDQQTVQFGPCSGMMVRDIATNALRPGTYEDAVRTTRLTEALEAMAGVNTGLGFIADRPTEINLVWNYAACCRNSGKIFSLGAMEDSVKWGLRMAQATGRQVIVPASSTSPLGWGGEQVEAIKWAARFNNPVTLQSMASPGTTAPVTLFGAALMMNAEILGGLVLARLFKPDLGVIYSCFTLPLDMRLATLASGSMELALLTAASAQLARSYGLPSMIWGPNTDSKLFDQQAGFEKSLHWLIAAQAGINLIWGGGMVENHSIWSDAQLMVDTEICGMVGRFLEGVSPDEDSSALKAIKEVGHFPNNFLTQPHTLANFRQEHYLPILSSRESREAWERLQPNDLLARAQILADQTIAGHDYPVLEKQVEAELERLMAAAAKEKGLSSALG